MVAKGETDARYANEVGEESLIRQRQERLERFACCGELMEFGHHFLCSKRPEDAEPAHVPGQESLL